MYLRDQLTPEELIRLHTEENLSLTKIGEMYDVSRQRVHQIKKEYEKKTGKITRRVYIDPFTLRHHIDQGWSAQMIADHYDLQPHQITRMIRKFQKEYEAGDSPVEVKLLQAEDILPRAELAKLYQTDLKTDKEIAEQFGLSASTVNLLRKKYHIPSMKTKSLRKLPKELTRDTFVRLYVIEKNTLDDLAAKYHCNVASIIRLKETYGIQK